jgi:S-adenosylmethionine decarboxylase
VRVDAYGVELYGCAGPIHDADALAAALRAGAAGVGATVLEEARATYQPHGLTIVLLLAESHVVLCTWPEFGYVSLQMTLCNAGMSPERAAEDVVRLLAPRETRVWRQPQRIGPSPAG